MKKYIFGIFFAFLLAGFTIFVIFDTFVITRVYTHIVPEETTMELPKAEPVVTDTSYFDENISIEIKTYRAYDTDIYVADVRISSLGYLKCAFANDSFGKNITQKTSEIAKAKEALFAVNGDYYGAQDRGCVVRNGIFYRSGLGSNSDCLVIDKDGNFEIMYEGDVVAEELVENGVRHIFSFGPGLLENGEVYSNIDRYKGIANDNPRTAIGIIDELHYVFVVCDGRTEKSKGLSIRELAEFMRTLGIECAYNLDGGGSSTMYFNGKIINKPTTYGDKIKERSVSDIVYIGYR